MSAILLDTCAILWLIQGDRLKDAALRTIAGAERENGMFVSPFSAWEIAVLVRKRRLMLSMDPESWFEAALKLAGIKLAPLPPRTLIASSSLPGTPPNDPADRIILATARAENLMLVTRDGGMLAYAEHGHVRAMGC